MRNNTEVKRLIPFCLALVLVFSFSGGALALEWTDFTDISGHWAEETLKKGVEDALISGFEDMTLRPDTPITTAQMITILCRVLNASEKADISALGIPHDAWYAEDAAKALYLGLISADAGELDTAMKRQDALSMMAKAFGLVISVPESAYLVDSYSDAGLVLPENRAALEGLLSRKLVEGFAGSLNANGKITRAEFLTVLYRTVHSYIEQSGPLPDGGNSMVKGNLNLSNKSLGGNLWLDCSATSASFLNVSAPFSEFIILAHRLNSLSLQGNSDIGQITIEGINYDLNFAPTPETKLGVLRLGGQGSAQISGKNIIDVYVTGKNSNVSLDGEFELLVLSGKGNTVTLSPNTFIKNIAVFGEDNTLLKEGGEEGTALPMSIDINGRNNSLSFKTEGEGVTALTIQGEGNSLKAELSDLDKLIVSGRGAKLDVNCRGAARGVSIQGGENRLNLKADHSIEGSFGGKSNEVYLMSDGEICADSTGQAGSLSLYALKVSDFSAKGDFVSLRLRSGSALGKLSMEGRGNHLVAETDTALGGVIMGGAENVLTVDGRADSIEVSGSKSRVGGAGHAKSINVDVYGAEISLSADSLVNDKGNVNPEEVLKRVSNVYRGNFTLQWALENDYEDYEKELWVNTKGYSSKTGYLLWINLAMQRVNIFEGHQGNWKLIRESIVGTGALGSPTRQGVTTTTYRQAAGWTTGSYTCKPVVGFFPNTGYAFHSRLYYPNSSKLKDAGIGYPISAGCVRMYDEDINYIFDHIPLGSTVVVY